MTMWRAHVGMLAWAVVMMVLIFSSPLPRYVQITLWAIWCFGSSLVTASIKHALESSQ